MTAAVAMRPDGSFEGQPRGFPFDDFEFEDVMLPEGDDMGIASEDDEVAEEELETETGFGSVIGAAVNKQRSGSDSCLRQKGTNIACCPVQSPTTCLRLVLKNMTSSKASSTRYMVKLGASEKVRMKALPCTLQGSMHGDQCCSHGFGLCSQHSLVGLQYDL